MKFNKKTLKFGTFTLITAAIVLAVVIAVNLLASQLPANVKLIDTTKEQIYTIGDDTKELLSSLNSDVAIYMILGEDDEDTTTAKVRSMVEQYADRSSRITFSTIDPEINPNFSKKYTEDSLASGSVIVESGSKNRVISASEWIMYETDQGRLTSEQYQQYAYMYQMYGQEFSATQVFLAETNLTSAISYVTAETTSKIYFLSGHDEYEFSEAYAQYIKDANVETDTLNLATGDGTVPNDCSMLIIYWPSTDISEAEANVLINYFSNGGTILLCTYFESYSAEAMPNLASLAAAAGMKSVDGVVLEGDASMRQNNQLILIPKMTDSFPAQLKTSDTLTYGFPFSHGIEQIEGTGANYMPLFTTSDSSYMKSGDYNEILQGSLEKGAQDAEGPFTVAAVSTLATGEEEGRFIWSATPAMLISNQNYDYNGNAALFRQIIKWTCDSVETVSIPGKEISNPRLTTTENDVNVGSAVLQVVIPLAIFAAGIAVWIVRRRKR